MSVSIKENTISEFAKLSSRQDVELISRSFLNFEIFNQIQEFDNICVVCKIPIGSNSNSILLTSKIFSHFGLKRGITHAQVCAKLLSYIFKLDHFDPDNTLFSFIDLSILIGDNNRFIKTDLDNGTCEEIICGVIAHHSHFKIEIEIENPDEK